MKKYLILICFIVLTLPQPVFGQNAQKSQHDYEIEIRKLEEQAVQLKGRQFLEHSAIVKKIDLMKEKLCRDYPNKACLREIEIKNEIKTFSEQYYQLLKDKKYDEAKAIVKKILLIKEKLCRHNPNKVCLYEIEIRKLEEQANQLIKDKKHDEAKAIVKKISFMKEKLHCMDDPDQAGCLVERSELLSGSALSSSGFDDGVKYTSGIPTGHQNLEKAAMVMQEALEISERKLGKNHPHTAEILNKQVELYYKAGRYKEVEPLLKRSLEINEKILGENHPKLIFSLINLADFYGISNRYTEASTLHERILKILEKTYGEEHINTVQGLDNLAYFYIHAGRYGEAESLSRRSLNFFEKNSSTDHSLSINSLGKLAVIYQITGNYTESEQMYKRQLEILQKMNEKAPLPGLFEEDVLDCLHNLAGLYEKSSRYDEEERIYKKIIEIREQKSFGFAHEKTAESLNRLAMIYGRAGRHEESHKTFLRSELYNEALKNIVLEHSGYSEEQIISHMNLNTPNAFFSHTLMYMNTDSRAVTDTFNRWILWKGSLLERQYRYITAFAHSNNPHIIRNLNLLQETLKEIRNLQLSKSYGMNVEEYRGELLALKIQKKQLEGTLLLESKILGLIKEPENVNASTLASLLHQDTMYIDFAKIAIYDFQNKKWGESHYLLFVLLPGEKENVSLIDLGATEKIDQHINTYLKEINKIKEQKVPNRLKLDREARFLYDLIIKTIEPLVKTKKHLLISPDGNLNLLPFEALVTPSGEHLLEKYQISYVSSGRDMVKFSGSDFTGGTSLIIADPDYDMGLQDIEKVKKGMGVTAVRVRGEVSHTARGLRFTRLPETKEEANAIDSILKSVFNQKVQNYQGSQAIEEMLYSSTSPKVLHLATHGYFFKTEQMQSNRDMQGFIMESKGGIGGLNVINIENPMLRSGIVLSGVNSALKEGKDDGMVSAEKIFGLPLMGTELVVLSACETGVGDVQTGEGVFGLKRAFILSGAKSLVMSLWSVPSTETTELMKEFYTLLSQGKTKADALRQAKLSIMKSKPNPVYWGAFVLTGSP